MPMAYGVAGDAGGAAHFIRIWPWAFSYFSYVTKELPDACQRLFHLSSRREDRFVAGLSMGGYGAWYVGLSCPERYSKIAGMSAAMDIAELGKQCRDGKVEGPLCLGKYFLTIRSSLRVQRKIFFELYRRCQENGVIPELYQACGTKRFFCMK